MYLICHDIMQLQYMSSSRSLNDVSKSALSNQLYIILAAVFRYFENINLATGDHLYIVLHVIIKPTTEFARLITHAKKAVPFVKLFNKPTCRNCKISNTCLQTIYFKSNLRISLKLLILMINPNFVNAREIYLYRHQY